MKAKCPKYYTVLRWALSHFEDEGNSLKEVNLLMITHLVNNETEIQTHTCLMTKPLPRKAENQFKFMNSFKNLSDGLPFRKLHR